MHCGQVLVLVRVRLRRLRGCRRRLHGEFDVGLPLRHLRHELQRQHARVRTTRRRSGFLRHWVQLRSDQLQRDLRHAVERPCQLRDLRHRVSCNPSLLQ